VIEEAKQQATAREQLMFLIDGWLRLFSEQRASLRMLHAEAHQQPRAMRTRMREIGAGDGQGCRRDGESRAARRRGAARCVGGDRRVRPDRRDQLGAAVGASQGVGHRRSRARLPAHLHAGDVAFRILRHSVAREIAAVDQLLETLARAELAAGPVSIAATAIAAVDQLLEALARAELAAAAIAAVDQLLEALARAELAAGPTR
jgi:hypothetical protein